ncbi:tRNA 2'-phosphotransferase 1 [Bienertia sinuspersici]
MVGRLMAPIRSTATNYLILHRFSLNVFPSVQCTEVKGSSSSSFTSFARNPSFGRGRDHLNMGGNRGGSRGHGHGGARDTSNKIDALGRLLVRILRHGATELNLDMRSDGYVKLQDLLKLNIKSRSNIPLSSHSIDEIQEAVRIDNKQRLGLLQEDGELWIRANQGHSVKSVETENLLEPILSAEEIPVCIHGTYKRHLESILASGLKRMNRLHIHFACGLPQDKVVISGMRRDVNLLIFIDTKKAMEDGMKFYKSENEVLLTEGFNGVVPAKYFQKIESWPNRKPVPFQVQVF